MVSKKKKMLKEKKLVEMVRNFVFAFGNVLLPLYIGLSSFIIAYYGVVILYNNHRSVFLNYLTLHSGGSLVADFFMIGIFIMVLWGTFGLFSMGLYKQFKRLEFIGFKLKKKPLIQRALKFDDTEILKFKKKK